MVAGLSRKRYGQTVLIGYRGDVEPAAQSHIRILIVDDHEVVREGLRSFLSSERDFVVVGEAADGDGAVAVFRRTNPDVVIMDVRLPGKSGIAATEEIIAANPEARIIIVTTFEGDGYVRAALEAGAWAYLTKDAVRNEIISAIRTVHGGKRVLAPLAAAALAANMPRLQLTPREMEVLRLMTKGLRNREIGEVLGTTEGTIKMQVKAVLSKLDVTDRTEAVSVALQRGLTDW